MPQVARADMQSVDVDNCLSKIVCRRLFRLRRKNLQERGTESADEPECAVNAPGLNSGGRGSTIQHYYHARGSGNEVLVRGGVG